MQTGNIESVYGPVAPSEPWTEEEVAEIMGEDREVEDDEPQQEG